MKRLNRTEGRVLLQRVGVSRNLRSDPDLHNYGLYINVTLSLNHTRHQSFIIEASTGKNDRRLSRKIATADHDLQSVFNCLENLLPSMFDTKVNIERFVHGYCYPFGNDDPSGDLKDDLYVLMYGLKGDTIYDLIFNQPIAKFGGEEGLQIEFNDAGSALALTVSTEGWIHQCDLDRGQQYCRERIVWLLNETRIGAEEIRPPVLRPKFYMLANSINMDKDTLQ